MTTPSETALHGAHTEAEGSGLAGLLARVEVATGADRELDARLWCLGEGVTFSHFSSQSEAVIFFRPGKNGTCREDGRVPYTASLDAALALVERILPEWRPTLKNVGITGGHEWRVTLQCWRDSESAWGSSAALALLSAMLKALIAKEAA